MLADGRGFAWVTRQGFQLVGLDEIYTAKQPAAMRLAHIAVNRIRLVMDSRGIEWESERKFRSMLELKKDKKLGPIPDAIIQHEKYGKVAIEIELMPKKPAELFEKVIGQVRDYELDGSGNYIPKYPNIWFYVPAAGMKTSVDAVIAKLKSDEQQRISCGVATLA